MQNLAEILNKRAGNLPTLTPMESFSKGGDPWLHLFAERYAQAQHPASASPFHILILQDWGSIDDETDCNKIEIPSAVDAAEKMKREWEKAPEDIKEKTTSSLVDHWHQQYDNGSLLVINAIPGLRRSGLRKNGELPGLTHKTSHDEFWGPLLQELIPVIRPRYSEIHLIFSGSWAFNHSAKIGYGKRLCPDSVAKVWPCTREVVQGCTMWWTYHPSYRNYPQHLEIIRGRSPV